MSTFLTFAAIVAAFVFWAKLRGDAETAATVRAAATKLAPLQEQWNELRARKTVLMEKLAAVDSYSRRESYYSRRRAHAANSDLAHVDLLALVRQDYPNAEMGDWLTEQARQKFESACSYVQELEGLCARIPSPEQQAERRAAAEHSIAIHDALRAEKARKQYAREARALAAHNPVYARSVGITVQAAVNLSAGFVYVLSNKAMPGILKIGRTNDVARRVAELRATGIPYAFVVEAAFPVNDAIAGEALAHSVLAAQRVGDCYDNGALPETFALAPAEAIAALAPVLGSAGVYPPSA